MTSENESAVTGTPVGTDRLATAGAITGALAAAISLVFPLGPAIGAVAILLSIRSLRSGTKARWKAAVGIAFGCISFLIVAGWAANGFK